MKYKEVDRRNHTNEITTIMIKETETTITIKEEDTNQEIMKIIIKEIIPKPIIIRCKIKETLKTIERDIELCVFYNWNVRVIFIILKKIFNQQ